MCVYFLPTMIVELGSFGFRCSLLLLCSKKSVIQHFSIALYPENTMRVQYFAALFFHRKSKSLTFTKIAWFIGRLLCLIINRKNA
jgi:hypothetical protein